MVVGVFNRGEEASDDSVMDPFGMLVAEAFWSLNPAQDRPDVLLVEVVGEANLGHVGVDERANIFSVGHDFCSNS